MPAYDEAQVIAFVQSIQPLVPNDLGRLAVNTARMQADATGFDGMPAMGYAASRTKHYNELAAEVGHPIPPPGPSGPFVPAPREWHGNMCGVRIPGLPPVPGGATDASLCLSWFYDRYDVGWRSAIRGQWQAKDYRHVLLSWPDSRAFGLTPAQFLATCQELIAEGMYPAVMLASKDIDAHDVPAILREWDVILPVLLGTVPIFCVGWELSLWLSPTQVQQLIDELAIRINAHPTGAQTLRYVHFEQGYMSFPQPDHDNASFWHQQVGKLTGVLAQKRIPQDDAHFLDWINDCLLRFAGGFNMPTGFDFVMLEISAMDQFNGSCSEEEGNRLGRLAINAPPAGTTRVMGSGNGH